MATPVFSQYLQTPTLFSGDTKQSGPVTIIERDQEYCVLFHKQRKRPSLQHIEAAGQIHLRIDYCACDDIVPWLMEYFHLDRLTIAHRCSRNTREVHGWKFEKCERSYRQDTRLQRDMVLLDVKDGVYEKVGTSYNNARNAPMLKAEIMQRQSRMHAHHTAPLGGGLHYRKLSGSRDR